MVERSFATEVKLLGLGDGAEFEGEAILAVTKALLQSGVAYVGGYQGAPVSHMMDVLGDASALLRELGVHFATGANEATAAAMLAASVNYPIRGAVTWKSVVGTNVASDALSNLASAGVIGGALIIVGEDYGEGSSIIQERTHAFAMKSQIWLLDPQPSLPHIVAAIEQGFALSEATHTPVMLMLRIRACHLVGRFITKANRRPEFTVADALANPQRSQSRIALPPSIYAQERHKLGQRLPAALHYIEAQGLNEFVPGELNDVGIVLQGGLYNGVLRALEQLEFADVFGASRVPLYVMNVSYPLVPNELGRFAAGKRALLVVEEGQPPFIEQGISHALRETRADTLVHGKRYLPAGGEYVGADLRAGIGAFLRDHAPPTARPTVVAPPLSRAAAPRSTELPLQSAAVLRQAIPARPPGLCTGCPERPLFASIKLLERDTGPLHVSADIGCHSFGTLPPFNVGASIMGYGLGAAGAGAFGAATDRTTVSLMGDGGFWHNGLTSGIADAVFNQHNGVTIIIDNGYSAATGGQAVPSSRQVAASRSGNQSIEKAVRGVGVQWVRRIHTYDMRETLAAFRAAFAKGLRGPRVIIAEGECQLNRQRRTAGALARRRAAGLRVVRDRYGVDEDVCSGDRSCIRLSGCPSLTVKPAADPLRGGVVAHVDQSCVGCGVCGEVAHAATLCPSFYRARIVTNAGWLERGLARLRHWIIPLFATRRVSWLP